jgi:exosortase
MPHRILVLRLRLPKSWTWWRVAAALALVVAGMVAALDAWLDILHIALRDEEASHIFLVPIVAAYLVWVRRLRLRHVRATNLWLGPMLVLAGWALHYVGDARLWQSVWHLGAIVIAVGCFVTAAGSQVLRQLLPAFLVLVFLIPVPQRVRQRIAIPMQNATARVTQGVFELANVDVTRSGNLLTINGTPVAIAEACNGLRMVFALVLVCYAFAFGNPLRSYVRVLLLVASPIAAIFCNVVRLVPTVYVYGHHSSWLAEHFHTFGGWVMLFAAFLMLMGILRTLRWALIPVYRFTLAYD